VALSVLLATSAARAQSEMRTWTSADGKYTTEATFLDYQNQRVQLQRADGKQIALPLSALSKEDQEYVRQAMTRRQKKKGTRAERKPAAGAAVAVGIWPRWRGPNIDGRSAETGLLKEWPDNGPPLLWQAEGLGGGFASVSVVGERIYTMGRREGKEYIFALDAKDGSPVWATPVGPGRNQRGSNCSPTVDGDLTYAISIEGDLLCVRADSGQPVWGKNFGRDFGGKMMSEWGYSESPLVDGDLLVCTPGGERAILAAMNKRTGAVAWNTPMPYGGSRGRDGAGYSSIVISQGAGVKQYVTLVGRGVIGVEAKSGRFLWRYERIANTIADIPTPVVNGDYVFCSSGYGDGGTALLKLNRAGGGINVQEVHYWPANQLQNHHGGMVLQGDHIYMGHGHNDGRPVCVDLRTGKPAWGPVRGAGSGSAAVLYADGHLYFRYQNGIMALIEADPNKYTLKSSFKLASVRAESWPHPVIAGGRLYLRDQEVLMCYDVRAK
jgi:outer membrane protein assembly factor BamB